MTLKNAALLALIGMILGPVLLGWTFVSTVLNVLRGLAPPVMLFPWFIYAFACFSVAVFFYGSSGRSRDFGKSGPIQSSPQESPALSGPISHRN
jgi:hypothetical protein